MCILILYTQILSRLENILHPPRGIVLLLLLLLFVMFKFQQLFFFLV